MNTINTPRAPAAVGPYSQAVSANGTVYVSGQIPADPATGVLETDIRKATARCLDNVEAILAEAGLSLADCLKVTVYLADMDDFAAMNEVYAARFAQPYPARACMAVRALPKGARVEIECVAAERAR